MSGTILLLDEERRAGESDVTVLRRLLAERPGQVVEVLTRGPVEVLAGEHLNGEGRLIISPADNRP